MDELNVGDKYVLFISELNALYSKHILNFVSEANDKVLSVDWSNLESLKEIKRNSVDLVTIVTCQNHDKAFVTFLMNIWGLIKPTGTVQLFCKNSPEGNDLKPYFDSVFHNVVSEQWQDFLLIKGRKFDHQSVQPVFINPTSTQEKLNMWDNLESSDLLDESQFLVESDFEPPTVLETKCSTESTRRACKNCTCGRAESQFNNSMPQKPRLTLDMLDNPGVNSSCGSCALGDAFRCSGCPYRGLPQFTPGQKIVLPDDFDYDQLLQ